MPVPNHQLVTKLVQASNDTAFVSHILVLRFQPSRVNVFCWASATDDLDAVTFDALSARKIAVLGYRIAALDVQWEVKGVLESREPYRIRRSDDSEAGKAFMASRDFELGLLATDPCSRRVVFDFSKDETEEARRYAAQLSLSLKETSARAAVATAGTLHLV